MDLELLKRLSCIRNYRRYKSDVHSVVNFGSSAFRVYSRNSKYSSFKTYSNRRSITSFSHSARKNMLFRLQLINQEYLYNMGYSAFFITLTYHPSYFSRISVFDTKQHLELLHHRLEYTFGKNSFFFFYKLEFTRRQVPHYHLFLVFNSSISWDRMVSYISTTWHSILTNYISVSFSLSNRILRAGTNVRIVDLSRKDMLFAYINKEVSKTVQTNNIKCSPGRFWGIKGRAFYKRCITDVSFKFYYSKQFFSFRRIVFKYLKKKGLDVSSYKKSIKYNMFSGFYAFYIKDISIFIKLYYYLLDNSFL